MQSATVRALVEARSTVYFDMEVPHLPGVYQPTKITLRGTLQEDLHNGWLIVYVEGTYPSFEVHVWVDYLRTTPKYRPGDATTNLALMELGHTT